MYAVMVMGLCTLKSASVPVGTLGFGVDMGLGLGLQLGALAMTEQPYLSC